MNISGFISKDISKSYVKLAINTALSLNFDIGSIVDALLSGAATYIAGSWIYVYMLPVDFIIPGFGTIMAAIAGVVAGLIYFFNQNRRQEHIKELENKIASSLRDEIRKRKRTIINNIIDGHMESDTPSAGCKRNKTLLFKNL